MEQILKSELAQMMVQVKVGPAVPLPIRHRPENGVGRRRVLARLLAKAVQVSK